MKPILRLALVCGFGLTSCAHDRPVTTVKPIVHHSTTTVDTGRSNDVLTPSDRVVTTEKTVIAPMVEHTPVTYDDPGVAVAPVDNSKHNVVDRDNTTLTAGDQSEAKGDIQITAAIRRGVVKKAGMSSNGKNIKIITRAGRVTLRGPIGSADELAYVDQLARNTAGVVTVDNQLKVNAH